LENLTYLQRIQAFKASAATLESAYGACEHDARAHYENFPVASLLLPRGMRPHVAAVYAFARAADDMVDEGQWLESERHALLDGWLRRLRQAAASADASAPPAPGEPANTVEIFLALGASIRAMGLPVSLFEDLVSAFRQDITTTRYASWADLFDYCRRSANPVGRLVLQIAGCRDRALDAASDAVCTALQLTNFWQDLKIDFERGRIYLPADVRAAYGAREDDLRAGDLTPGWRRAMALAVACTRELFDAGRSVCDRVGGRLGWELRATWLGGTHILDKLERAGFDSVRARPTLGVTDAPWFLWRLLTWRLHRRQSPARLRDST
jgi:squalene synthase HpnC